jgi:hypothetical protein
MSRDAGVVDDLDLGGIQRLEIAGAIGFVRDPGAERIGVIE